MNDDELRDNAAIHLMPVALQMHTRIEPGLGINAAPKTSVDLTGAALTAYQMGDALVKARRHLQANAEYEAQKEMMKNARRATSQAGTVLTTK